MSAILPFAQALPQELQVPTMSPDFGQIQQIAQKANSIFETGVHQVKNAYSSVLNAPVTSSRNLQKKQEYVKNFKDGLQKITKEDLRMPQNITQAENLLSPFWQDQVMMTDMSQTAALQSQMGAYEQAANSSEEKIRGTANAASLEDLNNFAEKLRNAGDDINNYTKLGTPKYLPLDRVGDYMTDLMIKDKDDANITFTSKYVVDPLTGEDAVDKNGNKILLPPGEIITQTNGIKAVPAKTHLAATRIGDRFNPQYELIAKNQYTRAVKMIKQQYQGISDSEAEGVVNKEFYNTIKQPVANQLDMYTGAIDTYKSRIETFEQQKGLTDKQKEALSQTKLLLKDAEDKQIQLKNTLSDMDTNSGKVTSNFIINRLAHDGKYKDVDEWGKTMAFHNVKSEIKKDEPYFATLEANDKRFGLALTQNRDKETARHDQAIEGHQMREDEINMLKNVAEYPQLAEWYRSKGINISNMGGMSPSGLPQGATSSGLATNMQVEYKVGKLYQDMRQSSINQVADGLWGIQDQNNPLGGIVFAIQDKFTANEFDALRKYQEMHQRGGQLTYINNGTQFIPQSVQEGKDYEAAINKLCTLTGKKRSEIKSASDVTNMVSDMVGTNLSQYMQDGVNHDKIAQYTQAFSKTKTIYDKIRREDEEHDKLVEQRAKGNEALYQHALVVNPDGSKRMIRDTDIPINYSVEGVGNDGKHYTLSAAQLRQKYLSGQVEVHYPDPNSPSPFGSPIVKVDGVEIYPTKIGNKDYQTLYEEQHSMSVFGTHPGRSELAGGTGHGTNPAALNQLAHSIRQIEHNYGKSADIAGTIKDLRDKVVPNEQYYKGLTGGTDRFIAVPIAGDTKVGKDTKDNSVNLNYVRESLMPGNNIAVENDKGFSISDEEQNKLSQLVTNKADAAKLMGDNYGYLPADKLGRRRLAVRINTMPQTKAEGVSPYKELEGKTYYITVSPAAQGAFLTSLPPVQDRRMYDPLFSNNPQTNAEYPTQYQKNLGVDTKLVFNRTAGRYEVTGTYYTTDKATGKKIKNTLNGTFPASKNPDDVRAEYQKANQRAVDTTIGSDKVYVTTNSK